jgi:hypothetical protein
MYEGYDPEKIGPLTTKELIKALQQEILELREFYLAHCEVEKGLASFDLHNEAVMRLRKAQEVLVKNDYEGRWG